MQVQTAPVQSSRIKDWKPTVTLVALYNVHAIGARSIQAYLARKGYPVNLICFKHMDLNDAELPTRTEVDLLLDLIDQLDTDVIGLSLNWSAIAGVAEYLYKQMRARFDVPILVGGVNAIMDSERTAAWSDLTCVGEGELSMVDYLERYRTGQPVDPVADLWIRSDNGAMTRNEKSSPLPNLDSFGIPSYDDDTQFFIDHNRVIPGDARRQAPGVLFTIASRGCPMQCTFCSSPTMRRGYFQKGAFLRYKSVTNLMKELHMAREALGKDLRFIDFSDDIFGLNPNWLEEFAQVYPKEIGLPFTCFQFPTTATENVIRLLQKAGVAHVRIGLQSGSERVRREIFKRQDTNRQIAQAAETCARYGVRLNFDIITDNPWETDVDRRETLQLMLELQKGYSLHMFNLTYYPGTELTRRALEEGITEEPFAFERARIRESLAQGAPEETHRIEQAQFRTLSLGENYWRSLIALAGRKGVPRALVRLLARMVWLRSFPRPLIVFSMFVTFLSHARRGAHMLFSGQVSLAMFGKLARMVLINRDTYR